MSDNMVERVARAIVNAKGKSDNELYEGMPIWCHFQDEARAAIKAIREPTEEMMMAGMPYNMLGRPAVKESWQAMIDEALKEKP